MLSRIAALRVERAQLMGYKTLADYVLEENMAKTPAGVYNLLNQLWTPARKVALKEAADMQAMIDKEGGTFKLEAGDWRYYTEKVKKARFDLDEQMLRPYFKLDNVVQGAFTVANKLYGITFTPIPNLPVVQPRGQGLRSEGRERRAPRRVPGRLSSPSRQADRRVERACARQFHA